MVGTARCGVRTPPRGVPTQRAMHHQIGITPDGTGEMQIICFRQAIMTQRLRIVSGALEAFEQSDLERLLLGLSTDCAEQPLQLSAMSQIANPVIKAKHECSILGEFFRVWVFVDAID